MNKLEEYIKVYSGWLTKEFCSQIRSEIYNVKWDKHTFVSWVW